MKQLLKKGERNKVGAYGEAVARKYLESKGFTFLEQNYLKPWGEIDLVMKQEGVIHFVEVKTVSHETKESLDEAVKGGFWRPEENVHHKKLQRLERVVNSWITTNK